MIRDGATFVRGSYGFETARGAAPQISIACFGSIVNVAFASKCLFPVICCF